jgi:thymidine kinase
MFSGKSEELMRRLRRVGYARKHAILVKPAIDDRYSVNEVVSHEGQRMAARVVRSPEAILALATGCDVVGVDEGQFLDDSLIDVCEQLVDRGIRVVIAGLDLDYRREPFGPMPRLLAMADEVAKLKAVCHSCGEAAMFTQRLVDGEPAPFSGETVVTGGPTRTRPAAAAASSPVRMPAFASVPGSARHPVRTSGPGGEPGRRPADRPAPAARREQAGRSHRSSGSCGL